MILYILSYALRTLTSSQLLHDGLTGDMEVLRSSLFPEVWNLPDGKTLNASGKSTSHPPPPPRPARPCPQRVHEDEKNLVKPRPRNDYIDNFNINTYNCLTLPSRKNRNAAIRKDHEILQSENTNILVWKNQTLSINYTNLMFEKLCICKLVTTMCK